MAPSLEQIAERLKTQGGRGFTRAVLDAFKFLGFEVEDIEETQGTQAQSDLIVKAPLATNPYFIVVECTAVREGSEVGYEKLYQLGSNFPRYLTKYSKDYPSASYKMLVGRPSFSPDAKKLAKDTTLMTAEVLTILLTNQKQFYLSQDELEKTFRYNGEINVREIVRLTAPYIVKAMVYAWIYLSLLKDPADKLIKRKKEWTNVEGLVAMAKQWALLFENWEIPDSLIRDAVRDLSSPVLRVLIIKEQSVMLSSLPLTKIIQNLGNLGESFEINLMQYINKTARWKASSED